MSKYLKLITVFFKIVNFVIAKHSELYTIGGWPQKQKLVWQSMVSAEARSNRHIAQPR